MPHDTTAPQNPNTTPTNPPGNMTTTGTGNDQPAIWLLNARIPHTAQYHACNCWRTGCGELDVFEVLAPGGDKVSTSVHAAYAGPNGGGGGVGDANYFARPVDRDAPVRVAVVLDGGRGEVGVHVLGRGEGEFPGELDLGVGGWGLGLRKGVGAGRGSGEGGGGTGEDEEEEGVGSLFRVEG